jgi:hypothetical protein
MPTLDLMTAKVRAVWLDEPLPNQPNYPYVFAQLLAVVQSAVNQIGNAGQNWETREASFTLSPCQERAIISADNIGKPLAVYTADPSNQHHYERNIPLVKRQNLIDSYEGVRDGMGSYYGYLGLQGSSGHVAQKMSVYEEDGTWYAQPRPITGDNGEPGIYKLIYSVGNWVGEADRNSDVILEEHAAYFELRAAMASLPKACWWDDEDDKGHARNLDKRKEIAAFRMPELDRAQKIFDEYVHSQMGRKISFKSSNY